LVIRSSTAPARPVSSS